MRKPQSGVMLLEALIAILIFSLGVLGIVGMQASAIKAHAMPNTGPTPACWPTN